MTELEKIAYAKSFLDKLANGTDPTNDSPVPEDDVAAKQRIIGCFSYVSNLLGTLIVTPSAINELYKTDQWLVTPEILSRIECTRSYVSVGKFAQRVDAALHGKHKFTAHPINVWLFTGGYVEQVYDHNRKEFKRPTQKGIDAGLVLEQSVSSSGRITRGIRLSYVAQCLIRDHLPEIISQGRANRSPVMPPSSTATGIRAENLAAYIPTEQPVLISQLAHMLSALQPDGAPKINPTALTEWLLQMRLLEITPMGGKNYKLPSEAGREIGISVETRHSPNGDYAVALYNADAQRFIVDHLIAMTEEA